MKHHYQNLCVAITLFFVQQFVCTSAPHELTQLKIHGDFEQGQLGKIVVPQVAYSYSKSFPLHLKITSSDGLDWPFFVQSDFNYQPTKSVVESEIVNLSFVKGESPYLQFDLETNPKDSKRVKHDRIILKTNGRDYLRRVELFSRDDKGTLAFIGSGYLVDNSTEVGPDNSEIRYPVSNHQSMHVRIHVDARNAQESFRLSHHELAFETQTPIPSEYVDAAYYKMAQSEEEKAVVYEFDLRSIHRDLIKLEFEVEDSNYARTVHLMQREHQDAEWRWFKTDEIYSYNQSSKTDIELNRAPAFLKVKVFHYNDPALSIAAIRLKSKQQTIVFEARSKGSASLVLGDYKNNTPRYDLKKRLPSEDLSKIPVYELEASTGPIPQQSSMPTTYIRWISLLVILLVSALVIWIIVSMMQKNLP